LRAIGKLAVDSNAVIAYREGVTEVCDLIDTADVLLLPAIVLGELLYGALNSANAVKNEDAVRKFAINSVLIPVDESVATRYAATRLALKRKGTPVPENDIWVASMCLELDIPLLSNDGHFDEIHDLTVIQWTEGS